MDDDNLEIGDQVMINPSDNHEDYVKEKYGQILTIIGEIDNSFYKVRGIKNYAQRSDLKKIN